MRVAGPDSERTTQFYLLEQGNVAVTTDHARVIAHPGEWVITTSKKREHRFSNDARMISLNLKAHWADDRPLFPDDPPLHRRSADATGSRKRRATAPQADRRIPRSPRL